MKTETDKQTPKHSPLPWSRRTCRILDAQGTEVAITGLSRTEAASNLERAELIVTAVNHFAEMRDALEAVLSAMRRLSKAESRYHEGCSQSIALEYQEAGSDVANCIANAYAILAKLKDQPASPSEPHLRR